MSVEMEQDVARRLFDEGATFVFLDVPPGTEFGIDLNTWNVGEKFKGVKMIPPGLHFVYYRYVGQSLESFLSLIRVDSYVFYF
jgi:A1 cistron-splicing factor AAR2